jgi:hypothetical protein
MRLTQRHWPNNISETVEYASLFVPTCYLHAFVGTISAA